MSIKKKLEKRRSDSAKKPRQYSSEGRLHSKRTYHVLDSYDECFRITEDNVERVLEDIGVYIGSDSISEQMEAANLMQRYLECDTSGIFIDFIVGFSGIIDCNSNAWTP